MNKTILFITTILVVSILLSLPLLEHGLYKMHDDQQVARLFLFDEALKAGQFPVRWVDELGFGFGYPLFIFYPPLVYMFGEIFHLVGFGFISSIKLVFFSSIFLSGVAMFVLTKEFWGRIPALVASFFYLLLPYRAVDVYIRGALAESFSFVWPPLILWSLYNLYKTNDKLYLILSSVFIALLMITHNLILLAFLIPLFFYIAFLFLLSKNRRIFSIQLLVTIILSASLSAFFWIPSLAEKQFTLVDKLLLTDLADYKVHFVYIQQLWNWPWGFGGSADGLADGLSFKIGKLHIITSTLAFIISILVFLKSRSLTKFSTPNFHFSTVFFFLFIVSAIMTTNFSYLLWQLISPLAFLQFPWRFLLFTGLFTSLLAAAFIYYLRLPILKLIFSIILVFLLIFPNLKLFQPQEYRPLLTDAIATSDEIINWDVSKTSFEYAPNGLEVIKENDLNKLNLAKSELPKEKINIDDKTAEIIVLEDKPNLVKFSVDAKKQVEVEANIFNFPGWQAEVDRETVLIQDNNYLKLITFSIPAGLHNIEIKFTNTPIRKVANIISLISIFAVFYFFSVKWRTFNKKLI